MSRRNGNVEIVECSFIAGDNRLADEMSRLGLSHENTARRVGMTHRQLTRILKGKSVPSLPSAIALTVVLGKSVTELFKFKIRTRKAVEVE
jgi:transcriptional regulator with XRE-family HTH domain